MERSIVERRARLAQATQIVPYLTGKEVARLVEVARKRRKGKRDALLILLLYQTGLSLTRKDKEYPRLFRGEISVHAN